MQVEIWHLTFLQMETYREAYILLRWFPMNKHRRKANCTEKNSKGAKSVADNFNGGLILTSTPKFSQIGQPVPIAIIATFVPK